MTDIDTNHIHLYSHDHLTEYEIVLGYGDDNEENAHMCSVDLRNGTKKMNRGEISLFLHFKHSHLTHDPFHLVGKILLEKNCCMKSLPIRIQMK